MTWPNTPSPRERLVYHVQELERLEELKALAGANFKDGLDAAQSEGFDQVTLRVVLKLRKMTPSQRRERRALEAIYMAALGMLEGDSLPDEARRRLDEPGETQSPDTGDGVQEARDPETVMPPPVDQPMLNLKTPDEARAEGAEAAAAGKRVYDNPYNAGDPCRAAWDEGWCSQSKGHGMETPAIYQRRADKPAKKDQNDRDDKGGEGAGDQERGAA